MSRHGSFLRIVVIFSLLVAPVAYAGGFETKIVFAPDVTEPRLRSIMTNHYKKGFPYSSPEETDKMIAEDMAKIVAECVFDLNKLSRDGWEIKASRRVWRDFSNDGEPDSYEWGTEYTLQKKIE
ncbi:MAG: hypothetical protein HZB33_06110 [Nitrospirae bacterium]|nr:hypothetical protein [Nitrospirota bacterium]